MEENERASKMSPTGSQGCPDFIQPLNGTRGLNVCSVVSFSVTGLLTTSS
jgi:hypothetical protein